MTTLQAPLLLDPASATPAQRLAIGVLKAECYAFANPDDPPLIPETEGAELTHVTPGERVDHFVVWDAGRALAYASLEYSLTQNLHTSHANLIVHPEARRRGLGRALMQALQGQAQRAGRRLMTFMTTSKAPAGEPFARRFGATVALTDRRSQLDLSSLDPALLERWQVRPVDHPYRLHRWQTVPEAYLTRMADMIMVMNTAPRGDLDMDDWQVTPEMIRAWEEMDRGVGEVKHTLVIEDRRSGELVGFSETYWDARRASLVFQGATAVRPEAQGLGLGKWLKAAMLRQVMAECPGARYVRTSNAEENAAMLGINVALGFTPWSTNIEWQLKL